MALELRLELKRTAPETEEIVSPEQHEALRALGYLDPSDEPSEKR